mgnify:CR=1 FL=1
MAGLSLTFNPFVSTALARAAALARYSALSFRLQSTGGFLPATRLASTESQAIRGVAVDPRQALSSLKDRAEYLANAAALANAIETKGSKVKLSPAIKGLSRGVKQSFNNSLYI